MKKIEIVVNGQAYNCTPTMGAMLRFKHETGKEITQMDPASFTDLCTYLYCCVVSAAKREGKEFGLSLLDFADAITPNQMEHWNQALAAGEEDSDTDPEGEKKSL